MVTPFNGLGFNLKLKLLKIRGARHVSPKWSGGSLWVGAALLFGLTRPLLKLSISMYDLLPVAGLLYVGAGLDLGFFQISGVVLFVASLLAGFLWV